MRFVRLLVGENNNGLGTLFWISRIKVREHRNETESCHYKNNKKKKITRKTAKNIRKSDCSYTGNNTAENL